MDNSLPIPTSDNSHNRNNLQNSFFTLGSLHKGNGFLSVYGTNECKDLIDGVKEDIKGIDTNLTEFNEWMKKADDTYNNINDNNKHQQKFQVMVIVAIAVIKVAEKVQAANGAAEKVKQAAKKMEKEAEEAAKKMKENPKKVKKVAEKVAEKAGKSVGDMQDAMKEV